MNGDCATHSSHYIFTLEKVTKILFHQLDMTMNILQDNRHTPPPSPPLAENFMI
jgi:hypothetical protein